MTEFLLVNHLKTALLAQLAAEGDGWFTKPPTAEAVRAVAELIHEGLVRDTDEPLLTITPKGKECLR